MDKSPKIIKNDKGFKVILCNSKDLFEKTGYGEQCSDCTYPVEGGYFVPATEQFMCGMCYQNFIENEKVEYYPDDEPIETQRFNDVMEKLGAEVNN